MLLKTSMNPAQPILKHDLERFFDGLHVRLEAADATRRELDRYLGSRFNLFEVLNLGENRLSSLLASLLDPRGGHGQGSQFLESFIKMLPKEVCEKTAGLNLKTATIKTEDATSDNRRIDIVISFGNQFSIGIENKPWASDQKNQLEDYASYLGKNYDDYVLVYLTGYSIEPSEYSISRDRYHQLLQNYRIYTIPYNSTFLQWIIKASSDCEAEKIRWLLRDFAVWVEKEFPLLTKQALRTE